MTKDEILNRYYADNFYCWHTRKHVEHMLRYLTENNFGVPEQLEEAILWHDAGIMPGLLDNEEISVGHYKRNGGNDPVVIEAILSTKPSNTVYTNSVERSLHDLDFMHFKDLKTLKDAELKLHNEYCSVWANYSHKEYIVGRIEFLEGLLLRPVFTNLFLACNDIAHENISILLKELKKEPMR